MCVGKKDPNFTATENTIDLTTTVTTSTMKP